MNSFSALHFVEAWEMWEFLDKPSRAFREGRKPDLLEMVHILEDKKRELARLIDNGASVMQEAKQAWDVINSLIIFPKINLVMIESALSQACKTFPALAAVREMVRNKVDLDSALVIAALSSLE